MPDDAWRAPLDRAERVPKYLEAIGTLCTGLSDMHLVDPDGLAMLIGLIEENLTADLADLRKALQGR